MIKQIVAVVFCLAACLAYGSEHKNLQVEPCSETKFLVDDQGYTSKSFEYWSESERKWKPTSGESSDSGSLARAVMCNGLACETSKVAWFPNLVCESDQTESNLEKMLEPTVIEYDGEEHKAIVTPNARLHVQLLQHNTNLVYKVFYSLPDLHDAPPMSKPRYVELSTIPASTYDAVQIAVYQEYEWLRTGAPADLTETAAEQLAKDRPDMFDRGGALPRHLQD